MSRPVKPGDDDPTESRGKPLPRDEGAADPTSPVGRPLRPEDLAEPSDPTVNVEADPGLLNDPRRVVLPHAAAPDDPTKNVLPQAIVHPVAPPALPGTDPTVNVTPDLAVVNDPNRVLQARDEHQRLPTVSVSPDLAVVNDPNRVLRAREELHRIPTVNVPPGQLPPLPPLEEPRTATDAPSAGSLLWVREEPPAEQTSTTEPGHTEPAVGTVTGSSVVTDPNAQGPTANARPSAMVRDATVKTDPDPTGADLPWEEPPEDMTRKLDLPAAAQVLPVPRPSTRTHVPLGGPMPPPGPSAPRGPLPPPVPSAPRVPRPSPKVPPKLDGVAPLVPLQPSGQPPAPGSTARTDPSAPPERAPVVPLSALANYQPEVNPLETSRSPPPIEAWKHSPEVAAWEPEEADQTKVISAAAKPKGLRPPGLRDVAALALGFVLVCVGMWVAHHDSKEGTGPLPAEKIKPPPDYVAPKYAKKTEPYLPPEEKARASTPSTATPGGGSGGSAAAPAAGASAAAASPMAGPPPPSTRLAMPRCAMNVPAALEAKVSWVKEGKRTLLRLRTTPKRVAIARVNLFVAYASDAEGAELVRTENAAVYFDTFLDPAPTANVVKLMLGCECGLGTADVQATIDKKAMSVDVKYAKPPEVVNAKARRRH